jgi:hypothetical protein
LQSPLRSLQHPPAPGPDSPHPPTQAHARTTARAHTPMCTHPTPRTLRHGHNHARKHSNTDTHPRARARIHARGCRRTRACGSKWRRARCGRTACRTTACARGNADTRTRTERIPRRPPACEAALLCHITAATRRAALMCACACVRVCVRACVCVCVPAPDGRAAVRSPVADAEGARGWPAADPLELRGVP